MFLTKVNHNLNKFETVKNLLKKVGTSTFLILMGQSVAVGILLWMISGWVFPFTTDSIMYISTAENIARFKGLMFTNIWVPNSADFLPMSIWPPGYPMGIAILNWMGINEYLAALILTRISCLLLPFLFFLVFRRLVPDNVSLFASGMCSLTFSVLGCSTIASSDTPYLALSLLVLMMFFNILERKSSAHWSVIVLTGVLSGVAFLVRYIGVSLIASIGLCLIMGVMIRIITFKDFIRTAGLYGIGVCLLVVPYCIRNFIVFGTVSVYLSPLPGFNLFSNMIVVTQLYFQGLSAMIFGIGSLSGIIFILIVSFMGLFLLRVKDLMREGQTKFICLLLVVIYFFIHSIFLIYYRSKIFLPGNPDVGVRLLMQLSWILLGGGIFVIYAWLERWCRSKGCRMIVVFFLVLVFVLIQIFPAVEFYKTQIQIKALARKVSQYFPAHGIPAADVIVSNVPDITYYFAKHNIRALAEYTPHGLLVNLGVDRDFAVFLVKGCGHLNPAWQYVDEWERPYGYKRVYSDDQVDLLVPILKYHRGLVEQVNRK